MEDTAHEDLSTPLKRVDVTSQVARRLLALVNSGALEPGSRLPSERKLSADLAVGRSAVREALAALSLLGVIEVRQGSGNYLVSDSSDLLPEAINWGLMLGRPRTLDLVEVRRHLEAVSAQLAASRASAEQIEQLRRRLDAMEVAGAALDHDAFVEADIAFHTEVAVISGNSVLSDILRSIRALLRVWIQRVVRADEGHVERTLTEHRAVFRAIAARDAGGAAAAMTAHMEGANRRLEDSLAVARPADDETVRQIG